MSTIKKISKMTNHKFHTEALIVSAELLEMKSEIEELNNIAISHTYTGSLNYEFYDRRFGIYQKIINEAEKKLSIKEFKLLKEALIINRSSMNNKKDSKLNFNLQ